MSEWLQPGERLDDLMRGKMRIIQDPSLFCFGTDAVLLADFCGAKAGERVCDLGTGVGVLPLLISARAPGVRIDAVEIQPRLCDIAQRNARMNGLGNISVHHMDICNLGEALPEKSYDCIVCNPPYFKAGASVGSQSEAVRVARHETACTLEDIVAASARLLRHGGRLCMVHQAARAVDVIVGVRAKRLEVKAVRAVHYSAEHPAKLMLFDARKGGRGGLKWLPPLLMRDENGEETPELKRIYGEE